MLTLPRYTIGKTFVETDSAVLYRGHRNSDGCPVVAKVLRSEYPTRPELARLRHEHALLRSMDEPEVVKAFDLQKHGNGLVLIMEDVGERSVRTLIGGGQRIQLEAFLELAVSMTAALQAIHHHQIIHKDIKPHHFFLVDGAGGARTAKLIDFGIATRMSRETRRAISPDQLEGTLAYMSPEQTGRMNRMVDSRSDLYGLGATLYELLTGVLPFPFTDPLELVHSHVARVAPAPRDLRPDVPEVLSAIIMKLLSKVAEDRYQSAAGVKSDLQECLARLRESARRESTGRESTGRESTGIDYFPIAQHDASGELHIPQKLYGREADCQTLLAAFTRAQAGAAEMLIISGYSGIGKSALVNQIQKLILKQGHFVAGKFDQLGRSVPYSAIAQACRELVRAILGEPPAQIEAWRAKLADALGTNAQLMVDLVPELELVLGPQPVVQELGPAEARHRFERTFQNFLRSFTSADHPLALFLDDLQWADPASLRLIQLTLTAPGKGYLLLIGAYRDNEVSAVHPLTLALEELRQAAVPLGEIRLGPLGLGDVTQFLADALGSPAGEVGALAEMTLRKTAGNPFFLGQFLTVLHRDGLLAFDSRARTWTWDAARLEKTMATDNVVDFMVEKIQRLSHTAQQVLRLAACVGHTFDRSSLELISTDRTPAEVTSSLGEALRDGLVIPLDDHHFDAEEQAPEDARGAGAAPNSWYRFLHDRVQQAAYALIDDHRKQEVHLRIGRLLLAAHAGDPINEELFAVVSHLNIGARLISDAAERRNLARLNMLAGRRARDAAAHAAAVTLLGTSLALLAQGEEGKGDGEDGGWQSDYEVCYAAHLTKAECEFLRGSFDEAFRLLEVLEAHARSALDRVPARALKITILTNLNRLDEAIACSVDTARMLGADIPTEPAAVGPAIGATFGAVQAALGGRPIESLIDLPLMQDPEKLALIEVLHKALPSAYQANPDLMVLLILKATALTLEHGNAPVSPYLYASYGLVHLVVTSDSAAAYAFGQLGIQLGERLQNRAVDGATHFIFAAFLAHWRTHLGESVEYLRRGLKASLEAGDQIHAGYCSSISVYYRFYMGEPLEDLRQDLASFGELCARNGDVINGKMLEVLGQAVANLRGRTRGPRTLDDETFDEAAFARSIESNRSLVVHYLLLKPIVLYFAGDYDGVIAAADAALPLPPGFFYIAERCFYRGLAVAAKLRDAPAEERPPLLAQLREAEQSLAGWAAGCPGNHAHRHALLAAELAVATGAVDAANDLYDRAIALAQERGFLQHQALANELGARFHLGRGRTTIARAYMTEAHYAYQRWGAKAKCEQIATAYPELLVNPGHPARGEATALDSGTVRPLEASYGGTLGSTTMSGRLDLVTTIRATQAIASELDLGKLLERLMRILVESAAAQRGFLILRRGEGLEIAAAATVDPDRVETGLGEPLEGNPRLAASVVQYVARSREAVVLGNAAAADRFAHDPFIRANHPRSLLCLPLQHQGRVTGVLYLENNAATNAFNPSRVELLQFLAVQAAIAVENAKLYGEVRAAEGELRRANETLEQKVEERTGQLARRNRAMRIVLDNVGQGLLTVDPDGRLLEERSAMVDRWFGAYEGEPLFAEYIGAAADRQFADSFALGVEMLREEILPRELCIDQLPKRFSARGQQFECSYLPVTGDGAELRGLLLVINDVTERLQRAQGEAEQRELLAVYTALMRDRNGFLMFFEDGRQMVEKLVAGGEEAAEQNRLLHTLKGNAAMAGLDLIAALCHQGEDELRDEGRPQPATLERLRLRWAAIAQTLAAVLGDANRRAIEVSLDELGALAEQVRRGAASEQILTRLESWRFEPATQPLGRLAQHARVLAERLQKGEIDVAVDAPELHLDPERWGSLWSTMVHLVRNAVDHGLESPRERQTAGKRDAALLRLGAYLRDKSLVIEVEDNGRGIDWAAVERIAVLRGLPSTTRADLFDALLRSDFSTRGDVTASSGRGVGLGAVAARVRQLGGTISVESEAARGTCWRLTFPAGGVTAVPSPVVLTTSGRAKVEVPATAA